MIEAQRAAEEAERKRIEEERKRIEEEERRLAEEEKKREEARAAKREKERVRIIAYSANIRSLNSVYIYSLRKNNSVRKVSFLPRLKKKLNVKHSCVINSFLNLAWFESKLLKITIRSLKRLSMEIVRRRCLLRKNKKEDNKKLNAKNWRKRRSVRKKKKRLLLLLLQKKNVS